MFFSPKYDLNFVFGKRKVCNLHCKILSFMQFPAFRHVVMRKLYVQDNVDDAVVNDDTEDSAFE